MDKPNLFMEDNDYNICLSWLCDSTDGQTYSISDWFGKKLKCQKGMDEVEYAQCFWGVFSWPVWEDAIGYDHNFRVDDPEAHKRAKEMVARLNKLIAMLNENPDFEHWSEDTIARAKTID